MLLRSWDVFGDIFFSFGIFFKVWDIAKICDYFETGYTSILITNRERYIDLKNKNFLKYYIPFSHPISNDGPARLKGVSAGEYSWVSYIRKK